VVFFLFPRHAALRPFPAVATIIRDPWLASANLSAWVAGAMLQTHIFRLRPSAAEKRSALALRPKKFGIRSARIQVVKIKTNGKSCTGASTWARRASLS
jgi:hypothetical protein